MWVFSRFRAGSYVSLAVSTIAQQVQPYRPPPATSTHPSVHRFRGPTIHAALVVGGRVGRIFPRPLVVGRARAKNRRSAGGEWGRTQYFATEKGQNANDPQKGFPPSQICRFLAMRVGIYVTLAVSTIAQRVQPYRPPPQQVCALRYTDFVARRPTQFSCSANRWDQFPPPSPCSSF